MRDLLAGPNLLDMAQVHPCRNSHVLGKEILISLSRQAKGLMLELYTYRMQILELNFEFFTFQTKCFYFYHLFLIVTSMKLLINNSIDNPFNCKLQKGMKKPFESFLLMLWRSSNLYRLGISGHRCSRSVK